MITGAVKKGETACLKVDEGRRQRIVLNHTATHLLQAALQKILGNHIKQAGSLVQPDRLRFDFTHFSPVTTAEIMQIEEEVNTQIRANAAVQSEVMAADAAQEAGAMACSAKSMVTRLGSSVLAVTARSSVVEPMPGCRRYRLVPDSLRRWHSGWCSPYRSGHRRWSSGSGSPATTDSAAFGQAGQK